MRALHGAELFLDDGNAERCVVQHVSDQFVDLGLQVGLLNHVVDDTEHLGTRGADRLRGEGHLAHDHAARRVHEIQQPGGVVRHAELGRGHGEGRIALGDHHVAGEGDLARPTPHTTLDHRDHRCRKGLDLAHHHAQWIVPAKRVTPRQRQLLDVMPGRPDLDPVHGAQHQCTRLALAEPGHGLHHLRGWFMVTVATPFS
jgi:hypothetical protein